MLLLVLIRRVLFIHPGQLLVSVLFFYSLFVDYYLNECFLVHQCSVNGDSEQQEPLCLVNTGRRFCIFSVVFSSDGREILGGANDGCLYIYDRHRHERTHKVRKLPRRKRKTIVIVSKNCRFSHMNTM